MLKIAVLYSGQFRTLDLCYENHKEKIFKPIISNGHSVDIFASVSRGEKSTNYCLNFLSSIEHMKIFECHETQTQEIHDISLFGNFENWLKQIKSVNESFELLESSKEVYDIIIRIRTDIILSHSIENLSLLEKQSIYVPDHDNWGGYNDRFAIGTLSEMKIYCNFYDYIKLNRSKNLHGNNAESYFKSYIDNHRIKVNRINTEVSRFRENGEIIAPRYE